MTRQERFWPQELFLGLLLFFILTEALVWRFYLPLGLYGIADFRQLYTGGWMVRSGHADELYDFEAQQRFQAELVPQAARARLLITHPAFEELLFVPFSLLPYRLAFEIFMAVNFGLVALCLKLLWAHVPDLVVRWRWFPVAAFASFFPISKTILQGQDSVLLLALLCGALVLIARERHFVAGILVGCGVFRFQIVLPIALMYLLWHNWRFVRGFAWSGGIAAALSLLVVGPRGAIAYIRYMNAIGPGMASETDMAHYANTPLQMVNLRGLIYAALWGRPHVWVEITVMAASVIVIVLAARAEESFLLAVIVASLVSYHFLVHDASIWILPILLALNSRSALKGAVAVIMLVAPFAGIRIMGEGFQSYAFWGAVPLLAMFLIQTSEDKSRERYC
jgi:Glycosyltransferase family 87